MFRGDKKKLTVDPSRDGTRTPEQIRDHYVIECELADQLRDAGPEDRGRLYSEVYDELFRRVPQHPLILQKSDPGERIASVADSVRFLNRFLRPDGTFLEIGPGDCRLALAVAPKVKRVYAVDVSAEITSHSSRPPNFDLILSDGVSVPVPADSVDVAYSKDLMEHLHPDDAREQLNGIQRSLVPGGIYICRTPNALSGPHDVSRYFVDGAARGLHLKEYTTTELARLFRSVGFSRIQPYIWAKGRLVILPLRLVIMFEAILTKAPRRQQKWAASRLPFKRFLSRVIATK